MSLFAQVKEKITQYIDVYIKLAKLNFIEGTAGILSYFMFAFICLFILFCIILFMGLGMTEIFIAIGLTKMSSLFITMGIYAIVLFIIIFLRKKVIRFFAGEFIKVMTEGNNGNEDNEQDE